MSGNTFGTQRPSSLPQKRFFSASYSQTSGANMNLTGLRHPLPWKTYSKAVKWGQTTPVQNHRGGFAERTSKFVCPSTTSHLETLGPLVCTSILLSNRFPQLTQPRSKRNLVVEEINHLSQHSHKDSIMEQRAVASAPDQNLPQTTSGRSLTPSYPSQDFFIGLRDLHKRLYLGHHPYGTLTNSKGSTPHISAEQEIKATSRPFTAQPREVIHATRRPYTSCLENKALSPPLLSLWMQNDAMSRSLRLNQQQQSTRTKHATN
ncbi:uncharacterized protein LOC127527951 [Erpetoichthys calabaricus]|uniref:uncharacterized protein LOC127527951 n=1 Tax=Erpetoichthys calabaricus TaxID=27687 RepID=UPI0022348F14|nr:uncharacterized protein LOC127527951 [Erpetoichthys calabaricus]